MPRPLPRRLKHGEEATLVEHLGELRARLTFSLIAILVGLSVAYAFRSTIIDRLTDPLPSNKRDLITLSPAEPFITSFMLAFYAGLLMAIPIICWQIWSFLAPAFEEHTQRIVAAFTAFATVLLAAGVVFGYFVALPAAVHFLTNYDNALYDIQIRARDYFSFAALVLFAMGIVFELPIFILALVRIGIVPVRKLRRNRRLGYVLMAALAVVLPGVDPVTTMLEMVPLMVLFEGSIWLAVLFDKRWSRAKAARAAQAEAETSAAFEGAEL